MTRQQVQDQRLAERIGSPNALFAPLPPPHAFAGGRPSQRGAVRQGAAGTCRPGCVRLRSQGFPGARTSGRPVGGSWGEGRDGAAPLRRSAAPSRPVHPQAAPCQRGCRQGVVPYASSPQGECNITVLQGADVRQHLSAEESEGTADALRIFGRKLLKGEIKYANAHFLSALLDLCDDRIRPPDKRRRQAALPEGLP